MEIAKVGVVGCGLMGHGIAQICAEAGWDVVVREIDQDALDAGIAKIEKQLSRAVEREKLEQADADAIKDRISATLDYGELADCDLVIEAITEDLDGKLEMWREIDSIVKPEARLRHQHLVALGRRPGGSDLERPRGSSACTSSTRPR